MLKSGTLSGLLQQQKNGCNDVKDHVLTPRRQSMEDLVTAYLEENLVRPATAKAYRKAVRRWIEDTRISETRAIKREDVLTWRTTILNRARPETWNNYRRHLRALMNYAVKRGWIDTNPFREVPPARTEQKLKKTVDADLLQRALALLTTSGTGEEPLRPAWFWGIVLRAFYYTGVRRRQLVELRWGDLDLRQGIWRIRAETSKTRREWMIPLSAELIQDLHGLYQRTWERLGDKPSDAHQVFNVTLFYPRYKGTRLSEDQLSGFFRRLSKSLGEPITPHRLRHTMATLLATHGDIRTLQEILGHTDISTTMAYVHPDVERMRSLVTRLPPVA
ncbi:MAG TPA: tyrosine-type recombinase/integrase [Thiohalobacter sp.]|nr:tyrosine-type recombinase/integrase [Thiohalobacter sp.]